MFKKLCTKWVLLSCLAAGTLSAGERIGIVDFTNCVAESKVGKEEQGNFDNIKQQLGTHLEQTEKELTGLASKLNDPDYMDGLSPEAEQELKEKVHGLNDELSRYQNQYYQVLNQANMKVVQKLNAKVNEASAQVAKEKKLSLVLHKDVCFFNANDLDVTSAVIDKMDKAYDSEKK